MPRNWEQKEKKKKKSRLTTCEDQDSATVLPAAYGTSMQLYAWIWPISPDEDVINWILRDIFGLVLADTTDLNATKTLSANNHFSLLVLWYHLKFIANIEISEGKKETFITKLTIIISKG